MEKILNIINNLLNNFHYITIVSIAYLVISEFVSEFILNISEKRKYKIIVNIISSLYEIADFIGAIIVILWAILAIIKTIAFFA